MSDETNIPQKYYDERIVQILDDVVENKENLKTPMVSLVEHIHGLGIIGNEKRDVIRSAIIKTLDTFGEKTVHLTGAYSDVKTIGGILGKIFNI